MVCSPHKIDGSLYFTLQFSGAQAFSPTVEEQTYHHGKYNRGYLRLEYANQIFASFLINFEVSDLVAERMGAISGKYVVFC